MSRQREYLYIENCAVKSKNFTSSTSSNYSTCSDNANANINFNKENERKSEESVIIAGQILSDYQQDSETTIDCSVNVLDQNLDAIEDDIFMDCQDLSESGSSKNESTMYLPVGPMSRFPNNFNRQKLEVNTGISNSKSDDLPIATKPYENDRLITIVEETEVTPATSSLVFKNPSPINIQKNNTGGLIVEMIDQFKNYEGNNYNANSTKRVLFAKGDKTSEDNQDCRINKPILKNQKSPKPLAGKAGYCPLKKKDIDENCNIHNTTESFVLWEKYCKSSERFTSRRSLSFSELNSVNESYRGDDEYSSSFQSIDDTFLSNCSLHITNNKDILRKKGSIYRSKSCDSLLQEVKHLPHLLYDKVLKCLAKEIDNLRKQNIVCTCQKEKRKFAKTEASSRILKDITTKPRIQISSKNNDKKEPKLSPNVLPVKVVTNRTRLSPETLTKGSSQSMQNLSPKSPVKTPTTPSKRRGLYSWQKEIVSPVGEYIKGKRQNPFQSSPTKKRV